MYIKDGAVRQAPGSPGACRTAWNEILLAQLDSRTRPCNFVPHLKTPPAVAPVLSLIHL